MTTKELIDQYVTAHADNRWMDASELETLLTNFAEEMRAKQVVAVKCEKKSPITSGEMQLIQEQSSVKFRGEEVSFVKKFYHCVDSGQDFTDTELDNDNMWAIFRAYWERKGFEHFYDIDGYSKEQKPASEDLAVAVREQMEYDGDVDDFVRRGIDDIASKYAQLGAKWQKEREFTHIEPTDDGYQAAIHYMEDCQEVDDFARRGIKWIAERYFIQGAKWREKQYLVSKDMEIAFKEYAKREHCECDLETSGEPIQYDSTNDLIDACRYGALLQKEQMMKDVVEGQVERGYCEDGISEHFEVFAYLSGRDERFKDLSDGQSVKVIIIKE